MTEILLKVALDTITLTVLDMYLSLDILYFIFWNLFQVKIFKEKNEKYDTTFNNISAI
jgi:hypothetical protein